MGGAAYARAKMDTTARMADAARANLIVWVAGVADEAKARHPQPTTDRSPRPSTETGELHRISDRR